MAGMNPSPLRVYGGVEGDHRKAERREQIMAAGLELLGTPGAEGALTVRGVCKQAGLAARYFYESFSDRDALAEAVYDQVIRDLADSALEAVAAAPVDARAKTHAGLSTIVRTIADDPRRGRLLFDTTTSTTLAQRRKNSTALFAGLLGGQAKDFYGLADSPDLELSTQFVVGGLAQTLTTWLDGTLAMSREELVEHCTEIFLALGARSQQP